MTGTDLRSTPPRRRPSVLALLVVGALLLASVAGIAAVLVHERSTGGATAEVALQVTRAHDAPAVTLDGVALLGPSGGAVGVARTDVPVAPTTAELGVVRVRSGSYAGASVTVGGRTLEATARTVLHDGGLEPLLLVLVNAHLVSAFWGNEAVNQGVQLAAGQLQQAPEVTFTDQAGRSVEWSSLRGRVVIAAALDTGCTDTCPLYTAVLADLERVLRERGWQDRVVIADISMDSQRDTPAELAAYASRFGADWELLNAGAAGTLQFWSALHYSYLQLPATPGQIDWYTGQPARYHLHHDSVALVFDANGYLRASVQGIPRLGHGLTPALAGLLSPTSSFAQQQGQTSWSITDLLDRIDIALGEPAEADRAVEQAARVGAQAPDFSLRALDGHSVSLHEQIGHPVVLNFFAQWCEPCRRELPLLARAAQQHPELGVLALDQGDTADQVRGFLDTVLGAQQRLLIPLLDGDKTVGGDYAVVGLPVTIFVNSDGVVRSLHVGELDDGSLQQGLAAIR